MQKARSDASATALPAAGDPGNGERLHKRIAALGRKTEIFTEGPDRIPEKEAGAGAAKARELLAICVERRSGQKLTDWGVRGCPDSASGAAAFDITTCIEWCFEFFVSARTGPDLVG